MLKIVTKIVTIWQNLLQPTTKPSIHKLTKQFQKKLFIFVFSPKINLSSLEKDMRQHTKSIDLKNKIYQHGRALCQASGFCQSCSRSAPKRVRAGFAGGSGFGSSSFVVGGKSRNEGFAEVSKILSFIWPSQGGRVVGFLFLVVEGLFAMAVICEEIKGKKECVCSETEEKEMKIAGVEKI